MKILILTVVVLALMTLTMTSRQMAEASVNIEDNNSNPNNHMSLNELLQSILSDPEFLSLDSQQQLQVLLTIYEMLADHYNKMANMKDNRRE